MILVPEKGGSNELFATYRTFGPWKVINAGFLCCNQEEGVAAKEDKDLFKERLINLLFVCAFKAY